MSSFEELTDTELDALIHLEVADDDTAASLLAQDTDLREFSRETTDKLVSMEDTIVSCTTEEAASYNTLAGDIDACDAILAGMETSLQHFCKNINTVTSNIQKMQGEVQDIQVKLTNRRAVEAKVSQVLDSALVPPAIIDELAACEISDAMIAKVEQVAGCSLQVRNMSGTVVASTAKPAIETLTLILSGKIRTFLLQKIGLLAKPKTNIPIIQQNVLLKYKPLVTYLLANNGMVGQEVKDAYVLSLSQIYFKKTKNFLGKLTKLEKVYLTSKDLITTVKKTDPAGDAGVAFSYRGRDDWVSRWDAPIVVPYIDKEKGRLHSYENLFRSMHLMLVDIITSEYIFSYDFFSDVNLFIPIFQKVISLFRESVFIAVPNVHDPLTLTSCIVLTNLFKRIMAQRTIHCLNGYLESVLMSLWTQLEVVVKANLVAMSALTQHPTKTVGLGVLPLTCKFAELSGILLSAFRKNVALEADAESVENSVASDHGHRVTVMEAMVSSLLLEVRRVLNMDPSGGQGRSERERQLFIAANLSHVRQIWTAHSVRSDASDVATLETWLEGAKSTLISLLIEYYLPDFVESINTTEATIRVEEKIRADEETKRDEAVVEEGAEGEGGLITMDTTEHDTYRAAIDENVILRCAELFGKSWQTRIPLAAKEVLTKVDFTLASDISSRLAMQIAIYNERLKKILMRCWLNPPCRNFLVQNNVLLGAVHSLIDEHQPR